MTTIGELAQFPRSELLRRLREAEARADRAEMRVACWALSEAFGALDFDCEPDGLYYAEPCACGHKRDQHLACDRECDLCACPAFVAAFTAAPTPDQRAAAAECGDVGGGRWRL